jgi:hypothetical protein
LLQLCFGYGRHLFDADAVGPFPPLAIKPFPLNPPYSFVFASIQANTPFRVSPLTILHCHFLANLSFYQILYFFSAINHKNVVVVSAGFGGHRFLGLLHEQSISLKGCSPISGSPSFY